MKNEKLVNEALEEMNESRDRDFKQHARLLINEILMSQEKIAKEQERLEKLRKELKELELKHITLEEIQ